MEHERGNGNGAIPPYAWATDAVARERLDSLGARFSRLEECSHEHEKRLDAVESVQARRRDQLAGLAGLIKAIAAVFTFAISVGGSVLAWLAYARH